MTEEGDQPDESAFRAAAMRRLDWQRLTKRLAVKASKLGAGQAAGDVAQDAIARMVKLGGAGWDPRADPTALRFLVRKVSRRLDAMRELEERRQQLLPTVTDSEKVDETPPESDRGAQGELVSGEAAMRNLERLRTSLAKFPLTLALLELCVREGQLDPRVVAEKLGVPVQEVYTAEAQLKRHVGKLRADGSDPEIRMGGEKSAEGVA